MDKLQLSHILIKGAELSADKINSASEAVVKIIDETKERQAQILKLKAIDQDMLKMVVQL